jgi:hypothetical protein
VLGVTPARSYLDLRPDIVRVRMGWGFAADIPRTCIRSVRRVERSMWSIGAHGWRGRWLVNGARGPIVSIEIDPPVHGRTILIPSGLRELGVSVDDPDALVEALGGTGAGHEKQGV